jgi:hypothetical protein
VTLKEAETDIKGHGLLDKKYNEDEECMIKMYILT